MFSIGYLPSNTTAKAPVTSKNEEDPKVLRQKEIEQLKKKYDKIYAENKGNVPAEFPTNVFNEFENRRRKNSEEVK